MDKSLTWINRIPIFLGGYTFLWGLSLSSPNAIFLQRFSLAQVAILLAYASAIGLCVFAEKWKTKLSPVFSIAGLGAFYLLSIFARVNQGFREIPYVEYAWAAQRFFIVLSVVILVWQLIRQKRETLAATLLPLVILFSILPIFDFTLSAAHLFRSGFSKPVTTIEAMENSETTAKAKAEGEPASKDFAVANNGLRMNPQYLQRYKFSANDWVIIGDSFVSGVGTTDPQKSFPNLIRGYFQENADRSAHVLGVPGAGPSDYIELLRLTKPNSDFDRVFLTFYPNDLDFSPYGDPVRLFLLYYMESASLGIRFFRDKVLKLYSAWDVDSFHSMLVKNFDENDITFTGRWGKLTEQLREFHGLAMQRSRHAPVLLILPIMVDFENYPLERGHSILQKTAAEIGYNVIDMLPLFRETLKNGVPYRSTPNDNHFNDQVHQLVAKELLQRLTGAANLQ